MFYFVVDKRYKGLLFLESFFFRYKVFSDKILVVWGNGKYCGSGKGVIWLVIIIIF